MERITWIIIWYIHFFPGFLTLCIMLTPHQVNRCCLSSRIWRGARPAHSWCCITKQKGDNHKPTTDSHAWTSNTCTRKYHQQFIVFIVYTSHFDSFKPFCLFLLCVLLSKGIYFADIIVSIQFRTFDPTFVVYTCTSLIWHSMASGILFSAL